MNALNVTVLGAGSWGTALALVLSRGGHRVTLWAHRPAHLEEIARARINERYLPGVRLPGDWQFEADLKRACAGRDSVIVAVPSEALRKIASGLAGYDGILVSVTKGIEFDSGLTMCGVLESVVPTARVAALSGPSLALEVAHGVPAALVAASRDVAAAETVQGLFHRQTFRVYSSADLTGVELGGALKNVVAIAAGVGDGLGFGDNAKAALITRAISEIRRLGVACGAQAETFAGLSGLGDLTATCFSRLSRNRGLGERLGRGEKLADILAHATSVAEGYPTARSARQLAGKRGVAMPIVEEVHAMLYEGKSPARAVEDLIRRESKSED